MKVRGSLLHCSFCGKSQEQVAKIIAGPGVYICDDCIALCVDIMVEQAVFGDDEEVMAVAQRLRDDLARLRKPR